MQFWIHPRTSSLIILFASPVIANEAQTNFLSKSLAGVHTELHPAQIKVLWFTNDQHLVLNSSPNSY